MSNKIALTHTGDKTAYMLVNEDAIMFSGCGTHSGATGRVKPARPTDRVRAPPLSSTVRARSFSGGGAILLLGVAFLLLGICGESNRTLELFPSKFSPLLTN